MAEEWQIPVGLTKEHAICLDDSSDDDCESVQPPMHAPPANEASKCTSSKTESHNDGEISSTISSYFQKSSRPKILGSSGKRDCHLQEASGDANESCTRVVVSSNGTNGSDGSNNSSDPPGEGDDIIRTADESEAAKPMSDETKSVKEDEPHTKSCNNGKDAAQNDNPFAAFAFVAGESSSVASSLPTKRKSSHMQPSKKMNCTEEARKQTKCRKGAHQSSKTASAKDGTNKASIQRKKLTIEMQKKDTAERQNLIAKWQAFSDPHAPIEQRRFQVLIAARIHARCQEAMVVKAMERLRNHFIEKDGLGSENGSITPLTAQSQAQQSQPKQPRGLSVHSLASADPETEIAPLLSSVLFGNVKAQQIVQAARDVRRKYRGEVPESIASLKEITGIGPKLAEILHIVNRRVLYS